MKLFQERDFFVVFIVAFAQTLSAMKIVPSSRCEILV